MRFKNRESEFRRITSEIPITFINNINCIITIIESIIINFKDTRFTSEINIRIIINRSMSFITNNVNNNFTIWNNSIGIINIIQSKINNNTLIESNITNINGYIGTCFVNDKTGFSWIASEILTTHICNINSVITRTKFTIINN